jgi:hypothetical protein
LYKLKNKLIQTNPKSKSSLHVKQTNRQKGLLP